MLPGLKSSFAVRAELAGGKRLSSCVLLRPDVRFRIQRPFVSRPPGNCYLCIVSVFFLKDAALSQLSVLGRESRSVNDFMFRKCPSRVTAEAGRVI